MPRASRITSPTTRRVVISTWMALLLVCSLGLAHWYAHRRGPDKQALSGQTHAVGTLIVPLPQGWQLVRSRNHDPQQSQSLTIASRKRPEWTVTFDELPAGPRRTPVTVLREMLGADQQVLNSAERRAMMPFRGGAMVGMAMVSKTTEDNKALRRIVAVMTLDGQTYWSMILRNDAGSEAQSDSDGALRDLRLLESLAQGATCTAYRPATPDDWAAADLPPMPLPNGFDAWHATDPLSSPAILLTPRDDQRWLRLIRLRGTPDTGATETDNPLSPAGAVLHQTLFLNSGAARPNMAAVKIAGATVIQSVIDSPADDGLNLHVAMASLGSGWTVAIDVALDLDPNLTSNRLMEQLLSRMIGAAAKSPRESSKIWTTMLRNGELLAQEHRQQWANLIKPGVTFDLLDRGNTVAGARVTEVEASRVADSLSRQGTWKLWFPQDTTRARIEQKWTSMTDGSGFSMQTLRPFARVDRPASPRPGATSKPIQGVIETLTLEGGVLRQLQEDASGQRVIWTVPMPAGYLHPVGEDVWPMKVLVDDKGSVREQSYVVWISRDRQPPTPSLVRATAMPDDADIATASATVLLRIRPLAAVDDDLVALDAQGQTVWSRWQTGTEPLTLRQTTREQLLKTLPWMVKHAGTETNDASVQ